MDLLVRAISIFGMKRAIIRTKEIGRVTSRMPLGILPGECCE